MSVRSSPVGISVCPSGTIQPGKRSWVLVHVCVSVIMHSHARTCVSKCVGTCVCMCQAWPAWSSWLLSSWSACCTDRACNHGKLLSPELELRRLLLPQDLFTEPSIRKRPWEEVLLGAGTSGVEEPPERGTNCFPVWETPVMCRVLCWLTCPSPQACEAPCASGTCERTFLRGSVMRLLNSRAIWHEVSTTGQERLTGPCAAKQDASYMSFEPLLFSVWHLV